MTIRRTAPVADNAAIATRRLAACIAAAVDATEAADAARVVRVVRPDGTVVVGVAAPPPPPPTAAEVDEATRERIRALRARLGGAAQPLR